MAVDHSCDNSNDNFVFDDSPSVGPHSDPNDPLLLSVPPPKNKLCMSPEEKPPKSIITPFGTYVFGEKIGRGAASCVYRALCSESGELAAVKKIKIVGLNSQALEDVLKEASILESINHPHIIKVYGWHRDARHFYLFLEYAENGSLEKLLKEFKSFSESAVNNFAQQILSALVYLHERKIIHRDIKAGNCLSCKDGSIKLADFGVSRVLLNETRCFTGTGSPYWMAPEVISNIGYGTSVDIWSLGCTIVELVTGKPPFSESNGMQAIFKIVQNDMPIPSHVSQEMHEFLSLCFMKNPDKRPSASTLLSHPWISGSEVHNLQPSWKKSSVVDVTQIDLQIPTTKRPHSVGNDDKSDSSSSESSTVSSPRELHDRRKSTPSGSRIPVTWKLDFSSIAVACDANGLSPRMSTSPADSVPWTPNSRSHRLSRTDKGDNSPRPPSPGSPPSPNSPLPQSSPRLVPLEPLKKDLSEVELAAEVDRLRALLTQVQQERDNLIVQHAIKPHIVYALEPRLLDTTPSTRVWSMALVNGRVWVGGAEGVVSVWNARTCDFFTMLRLHKTRIYALLKVGKTVWVSSEEGHIYIVNTKTMKFSKVSCHGSTYKMIRCLALMDRAGFNERIWSCAPSSASSQICVMNNKGKSRGSFIIQHTINTITQMDETVWLGCFGSIVIVNLKTTQVMQERPLPENFKRKVSGALVLGDRILLAMGSAIYVVTREGQILKRLEHQAEITSLCLFQNLLLSSDFVGRVICWDPFQDFRPLKEFQYPCSKGPGTGIRIITPVVLSDCVSFWAGNTENNLCAWLPAKDAET